MEAYGTEPPGAGWESAGEGKWVKNQPRIAILGGGPGGLFVGHILNQKFPDAQLVIFEATHRLGGKVRTDRFSNGTPFEAGVAELYEYLGPGGKDPLRLLIEEDLGLFTVNMRGGGVVLGETILRGLDEVEATHGPETRAALEKFHAKMAKLMPLDRYANRWQPDNSHAWAKETFHHHATKELGHDPVAQAYVYAAVHSDLATEPHTCNGLNAIKNILMDNDKYMQLYHVKGGIGQVAERLAQKVRADKRLGCRVLSVGKGEGSYTVCWRQNGVDSCDTFDAVIVCVPNHWLSQVEWGEEGLREAMQEVVAHYDLPAHYLRVSLLFEQAFWNQWRIPGDFWMMDVYNGCCVYNESHRWDVGEGPPHGHVLSFLLAGQDALLQCSQNQSDAQIVENLLDRLPCFMRQLAKEGLREAQVDRYAGSLNAMPGGWPVPDLVGEHQPAESCPGVFMCGDFLFDSTLNGALISANTSVDLLLQYFGVEAGPVTPAVKQLGSVFEDAL